MNGKQIALVSGANRGLGLSIAKGLSRAGFHVLAGCRDLETGQRIFSPSSSDGIEPVQLEVTDENSIERLRQFIADKFGKIDVLINNAGLSADMTPSLSTRDRYRNTFDVNVLGVVLLTEGMLPLLQNSDHARIVNISSSLASFTLRSDASWPYASFQLPFYQASKAALNALTLSHATAFAEHGIKVNAVCPGFTATEATQFQGRNVDESAEIAIRLAQIGVDGPTGAFVDDGGTVAW
ncbi:NAD(P)-dependent dehydrogenase, short-chain alcohol dehydrogenase family [Kushneria avicenniae]|uniref:NAD(P)-dependent dehydrogenase, short-chain alcohol dehydrogenase family n=1 Tax=Kushneria avicenniae TaxID=402385 RepID=A0A1I1GBU6_9GAMM|nr:SDR family NAD(P)-dependent oxidoreductase [Kushneria avicenniae]SFC06803.1 NAD(P)-dependent dehydrogenase, short-chain alcohol dehydrogenase family [Kushneria avicenniae]